MLERSQKRTGVVIGGRSSAALTWRRVRLVRERRHGAARPRSLLSARGKTPRCAAAAGCRKIRTKRAPCGSTAPKKCSRRTREQHSNHPVLEFRSTKTQLR
ncbi:unnamed protein product [Ectocarpus sp. 4 AP-2014]